MVSTEAQHEFVQALLLLSAVRRTIDLMAAELQVSPIHSAANADHFGPRAELPTYCSARGAHTTAFTTTSGADRDIVVSADCRCMMGGVKSGAPLR